MNILWLFLFCVVASPGSVSSAVQTGPFESRCLERHFMLSVKSSFLGLQTRFDFEDQYGLHFLSEEEASLCGYTVIINAIGDLVFRASFLACHVLSKSGLGFHLRLWFVNLQADGKVVAYPFLLQCSFQGQWSPREIVCEENYMEVSIFQPILPVTANTERHNGEDLFVMFHKADHPSHERRLLSLTEAAALGYRISLSGSHLTLRCLYSSLLSYFTTFKPIGLGWKLWS